MTKSNQVLAKAVPPVGQETDGSGMEAAITILSQVFGYPAFRGDQAAIIHQVLAGRDALVLMPTGAGKSLCYQIPSLVRRGAGIVISPLIALMQDQVEALALLGVRAGYLNSAQDPQEARLIVEGLRAGTIDLLYVAPERLLLDGFLDLLRSIDIALFAIDEAHCVSQWGHDFRPEYRKLSVLHQLFPLVPRIALTATADQLTRDEIVRELRLEDADVFVAGFDRPNIRYEVVEKSSAAKQLSRFLKNGDRARAAGIVYCGSRRKVEATALQLRDEGYNALPYHAGLDTETRRLNQQRFLREDAVIMVATVAFGMGINKPDVRFVAHLDVPASLEAYYQETGRAGRDGEPADAWMTFSAGDATHLVQRIQQGDLPDAQKRIQQQKLQAMMGYCESAQCRRSVLLAYFGEIYEACGNCDRCLDPVSSWDGTIATQKFLSAALRTGQRFGAAYLIDVLIGSDNERIAQNGHDRIKTFGVGRDISAKDWRSIARQLVAAGLLFPDAGAYGALKVTPKAEPILKGIAKQSLRHAGHAKAVLSRERELRDGVEGAFDAKLFEALRSARKKLADARDVPAFYIFTDRTLKDIARDGPRDRAQMMEISGVGEKKIELYGDVFLDVVRRHFGEGESAGQA